MLNKKKEFYILIISFIVFLLNLLSYSLLFGFLGSEENELWGVWAFSQYITLFMLIIRVEKILFSKSANMNKKARLLRGGFLLLLIIFMFCIGFYLSVVIDNITLLTVFLLIELILVIVFSVAIWFFLYKKIEILEKIENDNEKSSINKDTPEVESDILTYFIDKKTKDPELLDRVSISLVSFFSVFVYLFYLALLIYASFVCKSVGLVEIIVGVSLVILSLVFNTLKLFKYMPKSKKHFLIENSLLFLSCTIYLIVEWIFLPVTFNILLVTGCVILLIPIIKTQISIAEKFNKIYKK